MIMIIREKSINFVFNKSKYRLDSRKIDSKCIKNLLKLQAFRLRRLSAHSISIPYFSQIINKIKCFYTIIVASLSSSEDLFCSWDDKFRSIFPC